MKPSRAWPLLLAAALLGGCALLRPGDEEAEAAAPVLPPPVRLQVDVEADPLRELLETHLDLARLRIVAPGEEIDEPELQRLVAATPAQAKALLETEGYFNAQVHVHRGGGTPPLLRVEVDPGPRTRVSRVQLEFSGEIESERLAGDARAGDIVEQLRRDWPLEPGEPFRNGAWGAAKDGTLAALRAQGYAQATMAGSSAVVDAQAQQARLFAAPDSGPLFLAGELLIEGLGRHDARTVRNIANFEPGTPATETLLLDFQQRLQEAGLYERAVVTLDTEAPDPKAAPVRVQLQELPLQQASFAIGVDANTGARASVEHWHRRVFGWAATARNKLEYGQLRQAWEGELSTHPLPGLRRNLVGVLGERIESDVDTVTTARLRVGRSQGTPQADRFTFVQLELTALDPLDPALPRERASALSLNHHLVLRRLDSVVLPTEGYALSLQGGLGQARSSGADDGPFTRLYGRLTAYRPLGRDWYGQARLELGQVFVGNQVRIPDTQQFRAGGDESVRGYAYRALAPTVNGVVSGGNVLFTASAEVARPISPRLPAFWWAAFVDVGQAAEDWNTLHPVWGAGTGLRWRSPVGPLRLDVAYGEATRDWRLHLSVGVTF